MFKYRYCSSKTSEDSRDLFEQKVTQKFPAWISREFAGPIQSSILITNSRAFSAFPENRKQNVLGITKMVK